MPPPPEFRHAFGYVRIVEILKKMEAEHTTKTDGHIGVAGKIEIDLEGEEQNAYPGAECRESAHIAADQGVHRAAGEVGKDHFLDHTLCKADIEQKLGERSLCSGFAPIYVNDIRKNLERIEGNAERQSESGKINGCAQQEIHIGNKESGVLEKQQKPDIHGECKEQGDFRCGFAPVSVHNPTGKIAHVGS